MTASVATPAVAGEIAVLRQQTQMIHRVLHVNVDGLTQEDSLVQPQPAGNCINWVIGHLLCTWNAALGLLGQQPVLAGHLQRYERGSAALRNPAEALPLSELLSAWDEACARIDAGLSAFPAGRLDAPAPFSPRNDPNETMRSLLTLILFHQAYHTGQTALLRRIAGKEGAIK